MVDQQRIIRRKTVVFSKMPYKEELMIIDDKDLENSSKEDLKKAYCTKI